VCHERADPSPDPDAGPQAGTSTCVVATLAGKPGVTGTADGVGSAARFSGELEFIVMDSAGAMFISDTANHAIRKLTPDGTVTTFAGKAGEAGYVDGVGAEARFNRPNGLAFDAAGTLYVAEEGNDAIRKITPDGTVTTFAKGLGIRPDPIAIDAAGNVYTGGWEGNSILKLAPDGTVTEFVGKQAHPGATDAEPLPSRWTAADLKFDAQGVVWVVEWHEPEGNGAVWKVTPDGTVTTLRSDWDGFGMPGLIWIDPSGQIFATSYFHNTVMKISRDGTVTVVAGMWGDAGAGYHDGPGDVARFAGPVGMARDATGLFYVADLGNSVIRTMRCS
jgi:sugar lactone lactonase YvrE